MTEPFEETGADGEIRASVFGLFDFLVGILPLALLICMLTVSSLLLLSERRSLEEPFFLVPMFACACGVWIIRGLYLAIISRPAGAAAVGRSVPIRLWLLLATVLVADVCGFVFGGVSGLLSVSIWTCGPSVVAIRHLLLMYLDRQRRILHDDC